MRSYGSYIAGQDVPADKWVHCLRASAVLDDMLPQLSLKRDLDRGRRHDGDEHASVLARCAVADDTVVERAIQAAAAAAPAWGATPLEVRLRVVHRLHEELRRRHDEVVEVLVQEGHPRALAEWELAGCLHGTSPETVGLCAEQMHREYQDPHRRLLVVRKPDGVVALSPPQNAAAVNSLLGVPALAAGNALVVKAPRGSPYGVMFVLREIVAPILDEVGAPPGTLNIVCGPPKRILDQFLASPLVNDIFYFGSSELGIPLGEEAVRRGKKPILELAGNDGCVVWHDADLDRAAEALTESFFGSGQICMVPNYVVAHPDIADRLLARLISHARKIRPGYPEDPDVLLSPVLKSDQFARYVEQATECGAEVLAGGNRMELDGSISSTGLFVEPTILRVDGLARARTVWAVARETFFPLLPVVVPETDRGDGLLDDVIDFLNANEYSLRNSVWAGDESTVDQFVARVHNGGLLKINDSHIGFVPYLSTHGGAGLTGGPLGESNYPMLRTSHLQGISIGRDVQPRRAALASPLRAEREGLAA
ncbi:aldehyde dehydrogenase [Micromonospora ureilytica]|uniref:aldehyde dehydrogenase family protein n=1 Tax=Micromonospora ureilytica TaxID=709868 RepID=UPI002E10FD7A|nr:aldehyde dehydrogenase [Micromonospora ureilytica]